MKCSLHFFFFISGSISYPYSYYSVPQILDCLVALDRALRTAKPEIFNSDQGSQFTDDDFTKRLKKENIEISMDGKGRVFGNAYIAIIQGLPSDGNDPLLLPTLGR